MLVDEAPVRAGISGGLICGVVTAMALVLVFGQLDEYQVMDYADQDFSLGLAGAFFGALVGAAVIAAFRLLPQGKGLARGHVLVPLLLVPVAVLPLVAGLERNNLEAMLIWGLAALGVHTLIETRRWAAGIAAVLVVAALLTWACQHRWRAQKFEAVGLPLYVAVVPGYSVSGTWAGRYTVSMTLRPDGRDGDHYLDAVIRENPRCRPGVEERWVVGREYGDALAICLRDGAAMTIAPGYRAPDLSPLFDRTMVREVDGSVLANYRNGGEMEPD